MAKKAPRQPNAVIAVANRKGATTGPIVLDDNNTALARVRSFRGNQTGARSRHHPAALDDAQR